MNRRRWKEVIWAAAILVGFVLLMFVLSRIT